MRLKDRINEMIEQYSITHDNPTVLRELRKLSALTAVVIEWIENNDPADFTNDIAAINARMDEIENLVNSLHLETINAELEELRTSVNAATSKADQAIAAANSVGSDLAAFKTKTASDFDSVYTAISDADTKAEAAMALADGADTKAEQAVTTAGQAVTKAEQAETKADQAVATAGQAVTKAGQAVTKAGQALTTAGEAMSKAESVEAMLATKQDTLTFDQAPTANSQNPVTSGGVYKAIQDIPSGGGSITLDDTVTESSSNGVKSSGIYQAIEAARSSLEAMITAANNLIASHTDDIAALQEFQTTQDVTNETHNTQIAANKKAVDDLTLTVTQNEESVENRFTQVGSRIDENEALIAGKQAQLQSSSGDVTSFIKSNVDTSIIPPPPDNSSIPTTLAVYNAFNTRQEALIAGGKHVPVTVLSNLNDTKPTRNNLATAAAVWQRIEDKASGGGSFKIRSGTLKFYPYFNDGAGVFENNSRKHILNVTVNAVGTIEGQKIVVSFNVIPGANTAGTVVMARLEDGTQYAVGSIKTAEVVTIGTADFSESLSYQFYAVINGKDVRLTTTSVSEVSTEFYCVYIE